MSASQLLDELYSSYLDGREEVENLRKSKKSLIKLTQQKLDRWKPLKNNSSYSKGLFQVVDFFAGCGGMTLGFASFSQLHPFFQLIGGCDIDPDAIKTYVHNFKTSGVETDIRSLVNNRKGMNKFLQQLDGYDPGKPLVVIGCAPCQGFTSHRKKNWHKKDERNTLIGAFASVAVGLNPCCIVMENVPEMLSKKYWSHFQEAKETFEKAGYIVRQNIYNTATFGVPQERFRALIIAMKKEFLLPESMLDPKDFVTVRGAIGHLPSVKAGEIHKEDAFHRSANHRDETLEILKAIPQNGGSRPFGIGPKCLDRVGGFYDVYGRLSWDKPAITITHYARNPASGRFVHPEQNRGLTMREAALLQSFPAGFEFKGTFDSIFKQIGEAVPPKFASAVAVNVFVELLSNVPLDCGGMNNYLNLTQPVSNSFSSVIAGLKRKNYAE